MTEYQVTTTVANETSGHPCIAHALTEFGDDYCVWIKESNLSRNHDLVIFRPDSAYKVSVPILRPATRIDTQPFTEHELRLIREFLGSPQDRDLVLRAGK